MRQISLVGAVDEEVGDFFPEFLDMLEESPFLKVRGRFTFINIVWILSGGVGGGVGGVVL